MKKILLFLMLAACGFQPMYSTDTVQSIYVAPISGTSGIDLRNSLNAKFGSSNNEASKYTLQVVLQQPQKTYKALDDTGSATWQEIKMNASYTLKDGDKVLVSGKESASESYTFVKYLVASDASYNNAISNTIQSLADKISMRVLVSIQRNSDN
ncbi:MAG: LPS assembly lipoprotein LptE [Alphaproteobacteria bacterium]|nr:LPS assembly lipoprotein LptE [Alphaproteobacteria bacterium]